MIPLAERTASQKPQKGTRARQKRRVARLKVTDRKAVYARVDIREGGLCRFTRRAGWLEHHHIVYRSRGGEDSTSNIVLVWKGIHDGAHAGRYVITGDADGVLLLEDRLTGIRRYAPVPEVGD